MPKRKKINKTEIEKEKGRKYDTRQQPKVKRTSMDVLTTKERKKFLAQMKKSCSKKGYIKGKTSKKTSKNKVIKTKPIDTSIEIKKKETIDQKEVECNSKDIKVKKLSKKTEKKISKPETEDEIELKKKERSISKEDFIDLAEDDFIQKKKIKQTVISIECDDDQFIETNNMDVITKRTKTKEIKQKQKLPVTDEDIEKYQKNFPMPKQKLSTREILKQIKIPDGYIPRKEDEDRYIKLSDYDGPISIIREYTDDEIFFFTGFTKEEFFLLSDILIHDVTLSVERESGDCTFNIGKLSSCHAKLYKKKNIYKPVLFIYISHITQNRI